MPARNELDEIRVVAGAMAGFPGAWYVAGGWAIDLFVGCVTRRHEDREVSIFRRDQAAIRDHFAGWTLRKAIRRPEGGAWVPWDGRDRLELPVHQIQLERSSGEPRRFELFLNEASAGLWRFRRDPAITLPEGDLGLWSSAGIPIVAPEVMLLHKAKGLRDKDRHDFKLVHRLLAPPRRAWLLAALRRGSPGHPWIAELAAHADTSRPDADDDAP